MVILLIVRTGHRYRYRYTGTRYRYYYMRVRVQVPGTWYMHACVYTAVFVQVVVSTAVILILRSTYNGEYYQVPNRNNYSKYLVRSVRYDPVWSYVYYMMHCRVVSKIIPLYLTYSNVRATCLWWEAYWADMIRAGRRRQQQLVLRLIDILGSLICISILDL